VSSARIHFYISPLICLEIRILSDIALLSRKILPYRHFPDHFDSKDELSYHPQGENEDPLKNLIPSPIF
jgi:hypothetical protein